MAAEVETMFSVREKPWHGLGEIVSDTLCSADAIKKAGLDWKVVSTPMFTDSGMEIPNYKANIRDIDNKVLGVVSDRYQITQNRDAFDFTDSMIGEGCKYETAGSLFGGKKIFLLAKTDSVKILDDEVEPYMCFTNNHDGFGSIRCCLTPVRVVCNNTLNLALSKAKRIWSTNHVGDLSSKLEEAKYTLGMANSYMEELAKEADILAHTKVTEDEVAKILNEMFPVSSEDSDRRKRNIEEVKNNFYVCMFAPDILKFKGTAWQAINAMSDFATHTTPKRATSSYKENNFDRVLNGHALIDQMYSRLSVRG